MDGVFSLLRWVLVRKFGNLHSRGVKAYNKGCVELLNSNPGNLYHLATKMVAHHQKDVRRVGTDDIMLFNSI